MAKIYLVRHAESIANTKGIYQGQTYDTGLSAQGKQQAKALAGALAGIAVDAVVASPLTRTKRTAQAVADRKGLPVRLEPKLLETNHGEWEGVAKDVIAHTWPELYAVWFRKPSRAAFPGGEKFTETQTRVLSWWKKFNQTPDNTLVVTHDNIVRIILADILNMPLDDIWRLYLVPTGITTIDVTKSEVRITTLNDMRHLGDVNLATHAF